MSEGQKITLLENIEKKLFTLCELQRDLIAAIGKLGNKPVGTANTGTLEEEKEYRFHVLGDRRQAFKSGNGGYFWGEYEIGNSKGYARAGMTDPYIESIGAEKGDIIIFRARMKRDEYNGKMNTWLWINKEHGINFGERVEEQTEDAFGYPKQTAKIPNSASQDLDDDVPF